MRALIALCAGAMLPLAAPGQAPASLPAPAADSMALPFQDTSLPFEARAADLVGRLTLDEKVAQMQDRAPAIPRLGIPAYNWWNEALHGVARSGLATVFPQAIGLAATWNDSLMFQVATVISDEARAKHQEYVRQDSRARYQGLTFWSPNINIFRDPRWGRGQETYGEDPFLTGTLAVQFIRGMQGDDSTYLKTIATVKHFAVHSGPEPDRHIFNAVVSERDLHETYLRAFAMGIQDGPAWSIMCAYNRLYGKAACGSDLLLDDVLRGRWGFKGYVVSDCGAIDDIYERHRIVQTAAEAAALGVNSGTDLECGDTYASLVTAVQQGLITEARIDTAVTRLFLARMKLGMFDPPDMVRWAQIPFSALDDSAHRALARQAARESIVLLRNRHHTLPLSKSLRTIAVIGPDADDPRMLLGNYHGEPADPVTPLRGIREALPGARVIYARGADLAEGYSGLERAPGSAPAAADSESAASLDSAAVQAAEQADAVVLFLGLTANLEGEEMRLDVPGFKGGDRTTIDLPAPQKALLERIVKVGKPTVLVLMSGSALAVTWAQRHVNAIVEAWYPGQAAGSAIADVLFGDYNPGGRLPVTFYRSTADLPPFGDYAMAGRTYRFFTGKPLYAFGYGLSYTKFKYSHLTTSAKTLAASDSLSVAVDVKNDGKVRGDEVVQLYVRHEGSRVPRPRLDLRGYRRITLDPGQSRRVSFTLPGASLAWWDSTAQRWTVEQDRVRLQVGGSSDADRAHTTISVTP
ncbi:MAG TPA: glycoside hydrolase family 3 C-terminal domain-containing protein [Gemmatimonadaceae bacterium]